MFEYPEGFSVMSSRTDYSAASVKYGHPAKSPNHTTIHRSMSQSTQPTFSKASLLQFRNGYSSPPRRTFREDRYRLLHSIELSDSSGDEDVTLEEHSMPSDQGMSRWSGPDFENEDLAGSGPDPFLAEQATVGPASDQLRWNGTNPESIVAGLISTRTGSTADQPQIEMEFFEEVNGQQHKQEIPIRTEATHTLMDHSINPLHRLNVRQLRQLSQSLEQKVLGEWSLQNPSMKVHFNTDRACRPLCRQSMVILINFIASIL